MELHYLLSHGENQTPCKLTQPEHGAIRRIVLGVHGFGGSADDQIQVGIAEEMEMFSAATVRFDFPAHGENPSGDLTLQGCVDTLLAVAADARSRFPQVEDLCIFASGFGAYITFLAMESLMQMPGKVKLVVHTPSVRMDETLLSMVGMSQQTLRVMESVNIPAPRPFAVTYRFFKDIADNSVMAPQPIPMLILHGEEDDFIRMEDIQYFHQLNEESKLVIIPGASHRFLEPGAWDMVLDLTRDWFAFEQVLLSDWD